MDERDQAAVWYRALPDELRAEAKATIGPLPRWMVDSLHDAGLHPMPVQLLGPDGEHAFMMPVGLIDFLRNVRPRTRSGTRSWGWDRG